VCRTACCYSRDVLIGSATGSRAAIVIVEIHEQHPIALEQALILQKPSGRGRKPLTRRSAPVLLGLPARSSLACLSFVRDTGRAGQREQTSRAHDGCAGYWSDSDPYRAEVSGGVRVRWTLSALRAGGRPAAVPRSPAAPARGSARDVPPRRRARSPTRAMPLAGAVKSARVAKPIDPTRRGRRGNGRFLAHARHQALRLRPRGGSPSSSPTSRRGRAPPQSCSTARAPRSPLIRLPQALTTTGQRAPGETAFHIRNYGVQRRQKWETSQRQLWLLPLRPLSNVTSSFQCPRVGRQAGSPGCTGRAVERWPRRIAAATRTPVLRTSPSGGAIGSARVSVGAPRGPTFANRWRSGAMRHPNGREVTELIICSRPLARVLTPSLILAPAGLRTL
jgi:hypothetical protein